MTDSKEHQETSSASRLGGNQYSLMSLIGVMTLCAVGATLWARLGALVVIFLGMAIPMILFGAFIARDASVHRRSGWMIGVLVGISLLMYGIMLIALSFLAIHNLEF